MKEKKENMTLSDWSSQDLKNWVDANLIPRDLLDPNKQIELDEYIQKNRKLLDFKILQNTEIFYQTKLPPHSEWDNKTYEFQVIDKRTGKVVQILESTIDFELMDGYSIKIKSNELEEWKKDTAIIRKLSKEQNDHLKTFLFKFGSERSLTRKEINTFIEEIRKPKKIPKYRQSGHLVDQKLKYSKPNSSELSLFDSINPETHKKIKESKIEVKAEGIKLSISENKLIHALNRILYENSETRNIKSTEYYSGNEPHELVTYGGLEKQKAPKIRFKPSELYKAYMGTEDYSGADINFINNTLQQLESKKVLIKYDRIKKVRNGKFEEVLTDRIEDFQSLIRIISFIPDLTKDEVQRLDRGDSSIRNNKGELIIVLNPLFTDQIDTKFIEFPIDTNRRLVIAAGGHNKVTESMQTLMEWLLREMSNKRYKCEINEDNLPYILGLEKYVKEKRKKRLKERIEKDIIAITNMGIILSTERKPNSTGGLKIVFHLNKDYA